MKLLIVLYHRFELWNAPSWLPDRLGKEFPQIDVVYRNSYEGIESELCEAEILIAWSIRAQQLAAATSLRWIHSPAAAVHQLLFPELVNSDVILTNAREVHGPVVAEHVIAQILALAKKIPQAVRLQERKTWGQQELWRERPRPREVAGATLGLIGLGSIGREVALRAAPLGMRVIAIREHPNNGTAPGVDKVMGADRIDELLREADYVVLCAPLTAQTRSLMSAERLEKMKPESCLINVSRGPLVDDEALAAALRDGKIGGAALDVFAREPLPVDSPFWALENLLLTPHTAAVTDRLWERHYALIRDNLRRYLSREPLLAVVDKKRGY